MCTTPVYCDSKKRLQYNFPVKYIPGKQNSAADTLSRYPALRSPPNEEETCEDNELLLASLTATVAAIHDDAIVSDWDTVANEAMEDPDYQRLLEVVQEGSWPVSRSQVESALKPYFGVRDRLSVVDGLIL